MPKILKPNPKGDYFPEPATPTGISKASNTASTSDVCSAGNETNNIGGSQQSSRQWRSSRKENDDVSSFRRMLSTIKLASHVLPYSGHVASYLYRPRVAPPPFRLCTTTVPGSYRRRTTTVPLQSSSVPVAHCTLSGATNTDYTRHR